MAKYCKKPIVVEAAVYTRGMEDGFQRDYCIDCGSCLDNCVGCRNYRPYLNTLEGRLFISPGDYVVTGPAGERWPVKPDIFRKTYDEVGYKR